jgi:hypothetical protein
VCQSFDLVPGNTKSERNFKAMSKLQSKVSWSKIFEVKEIKNIGPLGLYASKVPRAVPCEPLFLNIH